MCDKKWVEVNYLSSGQYSVKKNKRFKTSVLRSDYSDAYIVVKETITVDGDDNNKKEIRNYPFRIMLHLDCISKINNTFIDNAEDLEIFKPMNNLLEHSDSYSMTS